ncbi:hypothetical protein [Sideroxydans lithotrophicus]|uniref:Uncharacterized protein n=1 Tax=Sideroxydans lithotrophicus (strain ES-1) TaxID=580332 RepID=D5CPL5_SIDLE|nr:hypothetical protein [Sideroxydans lithotrophicus]ADE13010.1 hypothetical protein Slit_2785 [Sideroxydans lithotrophicus ES-1]
MTLTYQDRTIERVRLIDDNAEVRQTYRYPVEELEIAAEEVIGPIVDISTLLATFDKAHDAVICDFNLKVKNYSTINGDEIVSGLYKNNFPAVLCTRIDKHLPEAIRRSRRHIPVVISPSDLSSETLENAFQTCVAEFKGNFSPIRRPWKTLIRIEGGELLGNGDLIQVNAIIPEWSPSILVSFEWRINHNAALINVRDRLAKGEIVRLYATVNVGAEDADDLFVEDWSLSK